MTRLMPHPALALALAPLLLLGSCGKSSAPQAGPTASGEILPGSVSDAMLDTDRSEAKAPLAPAAHSATAKADASVGAEASEVAADGAAATEAAPADQAPPRPKSSTNAKPATP